MWKFLWLEYYKTHFKSDLEIQLIRIIKKSELDEEIHLIRMIDLLKDLGIILEYCAIYAAVYAATYGTAVYTK